MCRMTLIIPRLGIEHLPHWIRKIKRCKQPSRNGNRNNFIWKGMKMSFFFCKLSILPDPLHASGQAVFGSPRKDCEKWISRIWRISRCRSPCRKALTFIVGRLQGVIAALGESGFKIRDIFGNKLPQLYYSALSGNTILVAVRLHKVAEESIFLSFVVRNNADIHGNLWTIRGKAQREGRKRVIPSLPEADYQWDRQLLHRDRDEGQDKNGYNRWLPYQAVCHTAEDL